MCDLPALSLILGGASSGKSSVAERLVLATQRAPSYIATAQAFDDEMRRKIADHKADREGAGWTTFEKPLEPWEAITPLPQDGVALLDCATMWLNNLLMAELEIEAEFDRLCTALRAAPCPVVVVSNEVGQGIVPENKLARLFRQLQGRLNAQLAQEAGLVVKVTAGLPMVLKGTLPERLK